MRFDISVLLVHIRHQKRLPSKTAAPNPASVLRAVHVRIVLGYPLRARERGALNSVETP